MNETLNLIKTPVFWVGTVIAGIIVAIIGNILTNQTYSLIGRFSKSWAARNENTRAERDNFVSSMIGNHDEQMFQMCLIVIDLLIVILQMLAFVTLMLCKPIHVSSFADAYATKQEIGFLILFCFSGSILAMVGFYSMIKALNGLYLIKKARAIDK